MGSTEEPMPGGERRKPPWIPAGAVGTGERGLGWALVHSYNHDERLALAQALRKLGWRVACPGEKAEFDLAPRADEVALVFSDDLALIRTWTQGLLSLTRPELVAIVEDRGECVQEAHDAGADWYMLRPIDPDDPLGVVEGT